MTIIKSKNIRKAHDRTFKAAMSDLRVAKDFLIHHLPMAIQEKIDFTTLQLCKESFIDPELRELITDILYTANFKNQENQSQKVFLYLCLEHQLNPDALMAWRMVKYTCRMIDHHLTQTEEAILPIVIPIVLYNGSGKYPYSVEIIDLFGNNKELARQWMFQRFHLIDLNQISDDVLRCHQWSGLMEMFMKHVYTRDILSCLEQVSHLVKNLVQINADDYLLVMIKYLIEKSNIQDRNSFYQWVHYHLSPPLEIKTMTLAEQLKDEGRQEGRQQGRNEGEKKGKSYLLTKQLELKFSTLPDIYLHQIKQAEDDTLLKWGERILYAETIEEVFNK